MRTETTSTDVVIVGAGPAGLLLSRLLAAHGLTSVVIEAKSQAYVGARIRAGIVEQAAVDVLAEHGLADRLLSEGQAHRGIHLQWPGERHHLDFEDLVGGRVHLYGQTELQKDLVAACDAAGQVVHYGASEVAEHDIESDRPAVTFTAEDGTPMLVRARAIAGCDGSFGPSRAMFAGTEVVERSYPHSWLGVLADVPPSTDELIYAWHPDGFALHSMRSDTVSRLYLQVPPETDIDAWSDDRIWEALATRLGDGQDGWRLTPGPITEKSVLPMRSRVQSSLRRGSLFLAGDAAHLVPPTGAKGLNLAIADVALLAPALARWIGQGDPALVDTYSERALRRIWRATHFSWWMTTMLHRSGDDFDAQLQLAQLRWVASSRAGATGLAENYVGLPIGW